MARRRTATLAEVEALKTALGDEQEANKVKAERIDGLIQEGEGLRRQYHNTQETIKKQAEMIRVLQAESAKYAAMCDGMLAMTRAASGTEGR